MDKKKLKNGGCMTAKQEYSQQSGPGQSVSIETGHPWRSSHNGLPAPRVVLSIAGKKGKEFMVSAC